MSDNNGFSADGLLNIDTLASVIHQVNLGVYVTDTRRRIVFWNSEAEKITGYMSRDVVGRACHENILVHQDRSGNPLCSTSLCPLFRAMNLNRESDEPVLVYAMRSDGEMIPVSVSVSPLKNKLGEVIGGIETFRDESARMQDLTLARAVQRHFLPDKLPEVPAARLSAEYHPHDLVGGDFYAANRTPDGHLALMVMDVSGHGIASAMFTTFLNGLVGRFAHLEGAPGQFLTALNRELATVVGSSRFVTAFYGLYDPENRALRWSSGGHPSPLRLNAAGERTSKLEALGPPLGIDAAQSFGEDTLRLGGGDLLLLYTDGVTELRDPSGEMHGAAGLTRMAAAELAAGGDDIAARIYRRLLDESAEIDPPDDITLVALALD